MENPQMQNVPSEGQNASGPLEGKGYETPGRDIIIESTSDAIHSPTKTSNERLEAPKPVIESIGQTPGGANPALDETTGFEQGQMSTADLLRAREQAEEELARSQGKPQQYQDQGSAVSTQEARDQEAEEDIYERREMHNQSEPSDLDRIAPPMSNIPPEE